MLEKIRRKLKLEMNYYLWLRRMMKEELKNYGELREWASPVLLARMADDIELLRNEIERVERFCDGSELSLEIQSHTKHHSQRTRDLFIKSGDLVITPKNTVAKVVNTYDQGITDVYKLHAVYESTDDSVPRVPSCILVESTFFATGSIINGSISGARARVVDFNSSTLWLISSGLSP